ncbi:FixH family protein [Paraherbaspirillum soli]|uniref:FixH family protein n=1 Tax=Paraherbaspirillum soli TaxID=631222 RepID=A0ABW0M602_9BURK
MKTIIAGILAHTLAASALAAPLQADIGCRPAAAGAAYDCLIKLAQAGTRAPVTAAQFTVSADMPSMPMAHNIRPVTAVATGEPGVYRARLVLEMPGRWNVKLRISSPVQDLIGKMVEFPEPR